MSVIIWFAVGVVGVAALVRVSWVRGAESTFDMDAVSPDGSPDIASRLLTGTAEILPLRHDGCRDACPSSFPPATRTSDTGEAEWVSDVANPRKPHRKCRIQGRLHSSDIGVSHLSAHQLGQQRLIV